MPSDHLPALCSLEEFLKYEFDFIVVGGGTAGLVIAARLTENSNTTVGVLEAGLANLGDPFIVIPAAYTQTFTDPKYDWCHSTVPQVSGGLVADSQATEFFHRTGCLQTRLKSELNFPVVCGENFDGLFLFNVACLAGNAWADLALLTSRCT
jgi:hypothetical protein